MIFFFFFLFYGFNNIVGNDDCFLDGGALRRFAFVVLLSVCAFLFPVVFFWGGLFWF